MLFVAFYLLVLGTLVNQNLGCKTEECKGKWVRGGPMGRLVCKTDDRDVSSYLLYVICNIIFLEDYEV